MEAAFPHLERTAEPDLHLLVRPGDLPWVLAAEPVVGLLLLPAVLHRLAEDPVLVAEAVAHGRKSQRRHRVQEARGQPSKPAVAQPGVGLLLEDAHPIQVLLEGHRRELRLQHEVRDVVRERSTDQELHRQVVDPFRVLAVVGFCRLDPSLGEDVADGPRDGLVALAKARVLEGDDVVEREMALVERVVTAREWNRTARVPRDERRAVRVLGGRIRGRLRGPFSHRLRRRATIGFAWSLSHRPVPGWCRPVLLRGPSPLPHPCMSPTRRGCCT